MIINRQVLENFHACTKLKEKFCKDHPNGLDISGLWGTDDEAQLVWAVIFASEWKYQIGWAISVGLLPARIRADLSNANLSNADLSNANLRWADLSNADLSGAQHNRYTVWPENFNMRRLSNG